MMKNFTFIILLVLGIAATGYSQERTSAIGTPTVKIVRFFPNPATTYINFEFEKANNDKAYTLQVYNFLGKKVLDLQQLTPRTQVDLTNYTRGVYIFQLKDRSGKVVESGKFQIEK